MKIVIIRTLRGSGYCSINEPQLGVVGLVIERDKRSIGIRKLHKRFNGLNSAAESYRGLIDIGTVEDLNEVSLVLLRIVKKADYAILNTNDALIYHMPKQFPCQVVLFYSNTNDLLVRQYCKADDLAAVCQVGYITLRHVDKMIGTSAVANSKIPYGSKVTFHIDDVLSAAPAACVTDISLLAIRFAPYNFRCSADLMLARTNEYYTINRSI